MPKHKKNSRKGTAVKRCLRRKAASGSLKLRSITMDRIRVAMEDFYRAASTAEGLFLLDALMIAYAERSSNSDSCALSEAALWCITGSGCPDLE